MRPIRLRPDNFTPATRTPWGGRRIVSWKADLLGVAAASLDVVGESWEISVDPGFPSVDADTGAPLAGLIRADPRAWLGGDPRGAASTPVLVKLLDAADDLSVQVHPADGYAGLAPGESGKPEAWYVAAHEPGAGIFLGLADDVSRARLADALARRDDLTPLLNFVEVAVGDCFVIDPGTIHAVGRGVTLVEPQLVLPGRDGKTYRLWDWDRRYDAHGRRSEDGAPRPLHVEHALAVVDFEGPRGEDFVARCRRRPSRIARTRDGAHAHLADLGPMRIERLRGRGAFALDRRGGFAGVTVLAGTLTLETADDDHVVLRRGESAAIPAALEAARAHLGGADGAEAILVTMPASGREAP